MAADAMEKEKKEEQARKAHALAERCFLAGNVSGARRWMQSAARLAPDLPGTPQIVAAYDVHAAAAAARKSRPDWYAVLGLKLRRSLTHDDVKKQYRRLCLLVHPDKNPSAAADGAFKLIHAAWDALSDRHPPLATEVPAPAKQSAPPPPPPQKKKKPKPPKPQPRPRSPEPPPRPRAPEQKPKPRPQKTPKPPTPPEPAEPKPKPPKWQPKPKTPKPQRKPRPQRTPKPPTPPEPAEPQPRPPKPQPRPRPPEPPTQPEPEPSEPKQENKCSNCGAQMFNRRNNYRCMSCHWSPKHGRRHQPHDYDDDDRHDDAHEDDYYYDEFLRLLEEDALNLRH